MNKKGSKKSYTVLIILLLLTVTIGYAALNSTLNINGRSNISKNTWDVHFENVQIMDGSVIATVDPAISNNTTISNFEITLDKPGDFYEFTVDVVNDGSIDAIIDSVTKTPDLTTAQQKYLNYIIEYQNGEQITTKQLVSKDSFVRLKVRIEYKKDISASDLPQNAETLNLGFIVNYVQSDGTGSSVTNNGALKVAVANGDINEIGTIVTIGTEQFYVISSDENSVSMLAKYNLEVGNIKFSSTNYWWENAGRGTYIYSSNSTTYNYVENYKTYLEGQGVSVEEARLISYDELIALGCSYTKYSCSSAPEWVYETTYWSGAAYDRDFVFSVLSNGNFGDYYDYPSLSVGVRPVIVISKNQILENDNVPEKGIIEFSIAGNTFQAEEGMTWLEWVDSQYNTDGFYIDTLRIIKEDNTGKKYYVIDNQGTEYEYYLISSRKSYFLEKVDVTSGGTA